MAGFDIKSLTGSVIREFGDDPRLEEMFSGRATGRVFEKVYVDERKVIVDLETPESRLPNASGQRSALVAYNSPTPKGNYEFAGVAMQLNDYRYAYPLGQTVFSSQSAMLNRVEDILFNKAGMQVMVDLEIGFRSIAQGTATGPLTAATPVALTNAQRWDNYAGASHNPVANLIALQQATGANKLFLSRDVANALRSSPVLTGSSAGSGTEFLSDEGLILKLQGLGFFEVYISGWDSVNTRPFRLPAQIGHLYTNMAIMWSDDALKEFILAGEEFYFDSFDDEDRKTRYLRAQQTSRLAVLYPDMVGYFTNILGGP